MIRKRLSCQSRQITIDATITARLITAGTPNAPALKPTPLDDQCAGRLRINRGTHKQGQLRSLLATTAARSHTISNMKNLPPWADAELSDALPSLAASGERQNLELKERFPEQARDLAKEIAAFATSNDGRILIGIADDGAIVGLPDAESAEGRGKIVGRIEGICSNSIKPNVTPRISFAVSDARVVACIEVPKGASPLYYVGGIPYLRQITAARGAEPDEVIEAVLSWHSARSGKQTPEEKLLSELASGLADVMIYASEFDDRNVGEWLDQLRSTLSGLAVLFATCPPFACIFGGPRYRPRAHTARRSRRSRAPHSHDGWDEMSRR